MALARSHKEALVTDLITKLRDVPAAVVASFRSLTVADSSALRRTLRSRDGRVRVVPKRLFRRVVEGLGWPTALGETTDSVVVAWSSDLLAPAQAFHGYVSAHEDAKLLGGMLQGKALTGAEVTRLATLPSLELLRAQIVSVFAATLRGPMRIGVEILRGLPAVLQAKASAER